MNYPALSMLVFYFSELLDQSDIEVNDIILSGWIQFQLYESFNQKLLHLSQLLNLYVFLCYNCGQTILCSRFFQPLQYTDLNIIFS